MILWEEIHQMKDIELYSEFNSCIRVIPFFEGGDINHIKGERVIHRL
jgi:hypothetical protein